MFFTFFKRLVPRVMSPMNGKVSAVFMIMVACLALKAIMKEQVEQLNKIGDAAMAIGIDKEVGKNRKV